MQMKDNQKPILHAIPISNQTWVNNYFIIYFVFNERKLIAKVMQMLEHLRAYTE